MTGNRLCHVNTQKKVTVSHLNHALLAAQRSAGGDRRLSAGIQSTATTQSAGRSGSSALCGPTNSIPVSGRATPALRRGWTNSEHASNMNHRLGLTHSLTRKGALVTVQFDFGLRRHGILLFGFATLTARIFHTVKRLSNVKNWRTSEQAGSGRRRWWQRPRRGSWWWC
jgi:hypothetical protein